MEDRCRHPVHYVRACSQPLTRRGSLDNILDNSTTELPQVHAYSVLLSVFTGAFKKYGVIPPRLARLPFRHFRSGEKSVAGRNANYTTREQRHSSHDNLTRHAADRSSRRPSLRMVRLSKLSGDGPPPCGASFATSYTQERAQHGEWEWAHEPRGTLHERNRKWLAADSPSSSP